MSGIGLLIESEGWRRGLGEGDCGGWVGAGDRQGPRVKAVEIKAGTEGLLQATCCEYLSSPSDRPLPPRPLHTRPWCPDTLLVQDSCGPHCIIMEDPRPLHPSTSANSISISPNSVFTHLIVPIIARSSDDI